MLTFNSISFIITLFALQVVIVKCSDETVLQKSKDGMLLLKDTGVGRTLGHHIFKRLAFIFLPIMFTLGVMTTLLAGLTVISLKNLGIGIALLVVGVSQVIARVFSGYQPIAAPPYPIVHYAHSRSDSDIDSRQTSWPEDRLSPYRHYEREGEDSRN